MASRSSSPTSRHRSHRRTRPARRIRRRGPHPERSLHPPGASFSLNENLGERTTDKGYGDGTVILDGRLTRGTGGGISQVSTVIYNLAYFSGADIVEFTPHAFFIPRYPEGREATVYWPTVDNRWRNDSAFGMLLQTWVADGLVHGRVWSTKTWDITSVKGPRRNVVAPKTVRDGSPTCYPQQPQPGFDVTVTRQFTAPARRRWSRASPTRPTTSPRTASSAPIPRPSRSSPYAARSGRGCGEVGVLVVRGEAEALPEGEPAVLSPDTCR